MAARERSTATTPFTRRAAAWRSASAGVREPAIPRLLERLVLAVAAGSALASCGPRAIDDSDGNGGGSAASESGGGSTGVSATSGTSSTGPGGGTSDDASQDTTAGADAETGDPPIFDVGAWPDGGRDPKPSDCFEPPPREPACEVQLEPGELLGFRCMPQEVELSCDGITPEEAMAEAGDCLACNGIVHSVPCGPIGSGVDTCCHWFVYGTGQSCPGRPFTVDGRSRLPRVVARDDWAEAVELELAAVAPAARQALARAWAQDGCFEHASIASFARFVLELLAMGAPASLVADAQQALFDEIAHARAFFGLAAAHGGHAVGPDALDIRNALDASHDALAIADGLVREGCIGETISLLQLQVAAARTTDPRVRTRLEAIADDELRHVELAWSALAWLLTRADANVRAHVAATFARAAELVPRAADASDALPPALLHAHGRLSAEERLHLAERALAGLVAPAAARLLAPWSVLAPVAFHEGRLA
jgi:hypothetical protein